MISPRDKQNRRRTKMIWIGIISFESAATPGWPTNQIAIMHPTNVIRKKIDAKITKGASEIIRIREVISIETPML